MTIEIIQISLVNPKWHFGTSNCCWELWQHSGAAALSPGLMTTSQLPISEFQLWILSDNLGIQISAVNPKWQFWNSNFCLWILSDIFVLHGHAKCPPRPARDLPVWLSREKLRSSPVEDELPMELQVRISQCPSHKVHPVPSARPPSVPKSCCVEKS